MTRCNNPECREREQAVRDAITHFLSIILAPSKRTAEARASALWQHIHGRADRAAAHGILLPRQRGRPQGRHSIPVEQAIVVAMLVDWTHVSPADLLRALGRDAASGSADFQWLDRRLIRGREMLATFPPDRVSELREQFAAAFPEPLVPNGLSIFFKNTPPPKPR